LGWKLPPPLDEALFTQLKFAQIEACLYCMARLAVLCGLSGQYFPAVSAPLKKKHCLNLVPL
jgi:hypothetical protein